MTLLKARDLREVVEEVNRLDEEAIRDREKPIDAKIRDLVIGLRRWGIETHSSCQGHFYWHPRCWGIMIPHVECPNTEGNLDRAAELLAAYTYYYADQRAWDSALIIKPFFGQFSIRPERSAPWQLWSWQRKTMKFGKWLQGLPADYFEELGQE